MQNYKHNCVIMATNQQAVNELRALITEIVTPLVAGVSNQIAAAHNRESLASREILEALQNVQNLLANQAKKPPRGEPKAKTEGAPVAGGAAVIATASARPQTPARYFAMKWKDVTEAGTAFREKYMNAGALADIQSMDGIKTKRTEEAKQNFIGDQMFKWLKNADTDLYKGFVQEYTEYKATFNAAPKAAQPQEELEASSPKPDKKD